MKAYLFNPSHDMALASGCGPYTPPKQIAEMEHSLEHLMAYMCEPGDAVLCSQYPKKEWIESHLTPLGMDYVRWVKDAENEEIAFTPWGMNFSAAKRAKVHVDRHILESIRNTSHRRQSIAALEGLRANGLFELDIPVEARSVEMVEQAARNMSIVVKTPYSSSGRGVTIIEQGSAINRKRFAALIEQQGSVIIEMKHERVMEFGVEYALVDGSYRQYALSAFQTNDVGAYIGNMLIPQDDIRSMITAHISSKQLDEALDAVGIELSKIVDNTTKPYIPHIGVDMMIARKGDEEVLYPVMEINFRHTMGALAYHIYNRIISSHSEGTLWLMHFNGKGEAADYCRNHESQSNLVIEGGRIVEGFVALTPIEEWSTFAALANIRRLRKGF